jgi:hypothetical protein
MRKYCILDYTSLWCRRRDFNVSRPTSCRRVSCLVSLIAAVAIMHALRWTGSTLNKWSKQWIVTFNASKTQFFIKSGRPVYPPLYLNNTAINEVTVHKHLGLVFNNKMSWADYINDICKKCNKRLAIMHALRWTGSNLSVSNLLQLSYMTSVSSSKERIHDLYSFPMHDICKKM